MFFPLHSTDPLFYPYTTCYSSYLLPFTLSYAKVCVCFLFNFYISYSPKKITKICFFPYTLQTLYFIFIPYAIHHTCYPLPCAFLWYMHRISFYLVVCCAPWWSTCYSILVLTLGPLLETVWREFLYPLCDFRGTLGFPKFLACLELDRALF